MSKWEIVVAVLQLHLTDFWLEVGRCDDLYLPQGMEHGPAWCNSQASLMCLLSTFVPNSLVAVEAEDLISSSLEMAVPVERCSGI